MLSNEAPGGIGRMPAGRYLRRAWPMVPAHALRDAFKRRDVKINGARVGENDPVSAGDRIELFLPDRYLPAPVETVFDDGRLIACVKPQGLPVDVDADGIGADTLLSRVRRLHPSAQLCHRLDAQTGGLVLAAADADTAARAEETFKLHTIRKTYLAIAKGGFARREGALNGYLIKNARDSRVSVIDHAAPGAKKIETRYRVIEDMGGLARVELEPVTGRTHQLRAHMASIGHPLIGDDKYGDRDLNRKFGLPLRLWCESVRILKESPLAEYRGQTFASPKPDWWK